MAPAMVGTTDRANSTVRRTVPEQSPLWGLTASDQKFLLVSLLITAGLLGFHAWKRAARSTYTVTVRHTPEVLPAPQEQIEPVPETSGQPSETVASSPTADNYVFRIDINQASWSEWAQLPGIGNTLAHRIVAERESHGPFQSIDDLRRVKGVGAKTLEKMRPHLLLKSSQP